MKNIILLLLVSTFFTSNALGQETSKEPQYYRVLAFKFVHGKADEATKRGIELFSRARKMIGIENMIFRSESGPYDLLVFDPVNENSPFKDDYWPEMYKAMVKIMGDEETLHTELEEWNKLVQRQETFYYKQIE